MGLYYLRCLFMDQVFGRRGYASVCNDDKKGYTILGTAF